MKLEFWGTRGAIPMPSWATRELGGNTTCLQVSFDDDDSLILDCGTGMIEYGRTIDEGDARRFHVLVTHVHWDHIIGFPFFQPIHTPGTTIHFHSPFPGQLLERYVAALFDGTYSPLRDMRNLAADVQFHQIPATGTRIGNTEVRYCPTAHTAECYAYRLEQGGAALSFVVDHERSVEEANQALVRFVERSRVLVHDAQFTAREGPTHRGWGHSSIEDAIDNAVAAQVEQLLLFHHGPEHSDDFLRLYLQRLKRATGQPTRTLKGLELAAEGRPYTF